MSELTAKQPEIQPQPATAPEEKAKWYGPYKIESEQVDLPNAKIVLTFAEIENNPGEKIRPDEVTIDPDVYNASVTNEKSDLTALRHKRVTLIVADVLKILLKRNIKLSEFEYMVAMLNQSINDSLQRSNHILWGNNELDRTMEDVDKVLKSQPTPVKKVNQNAESDDQE